MMLVFGGTFAVAASNDEPLPTLEVGGVEFMPIRLAAYALGIDVDWDDETRTIILTGPLGHVRTVSPRVYNIHFEDGTAWMAPNWLNWILNQIPLEAPVPASRTDYWTWESFADVLPAEFDTTLPHGEMALDFILHMNDYLYNRSPFTYREKEAARWIVEELLAMGYDWDSIEVQEFAFIEVTTFSHVFPAPPNWSRASMPIILGDAVLRDNQLSQNVILTVPGTGDGIIIVGAHYDSVRYPGASDNASGTALLLESAARLREHGSYHTVKYVFFGAEETGLWGAYFFYQSLTEAQRDDIVMVVNADVLFEGPYFIYGTGVHPQPTQAVMGEALEEMFASMGTNLHGMDAFEFIEYSNRSFNILVADAVRLGFLDGQNSPASLQVDAIAEEIMDLHDLSLHAVPYYIYMSSDQLVFVFSGYTIVLFAGMDRVVDAFSPEGRFAGQLMHTPRDDFHYIEYHWPGMMLDAMRTFGIFLEEILTTQF